MTWGELLEFLHERALDNPPYLQDNVTVVDMEEGEYYPADTLETCEEDDILDKGHLFITIKQGE